MLRKIVIGSAALVLVGSSLVYAQGGFSGADGPRRQRFMPSAEDMGAFVDARIAGVKAGLKLTPDQERNWPAFEAAYRGLAQIRIDRINALRDAWQSRGDRPRSGNMMDFMQRRAEAMTRGAAAFKQFTDATVPLYQSLNDAQKRRFAMLAQVLRPRAPFGAGRDRRFGPGGPGFGPGFNRGPGGPRFGDQNFDQRAPRGDRAEERLFTDGSLDQEQFAAPDLADRSLDAMPEPER